MSLTLRFLKVIKSNPYPLTVIPFPGDGVYVGHLAYEPAGVQRDQAGKKLECNARRH